jgi:peptidoglycan-associated lipoprotein
MSLPRFLLLTLCLLLALALATGCPKKPPADTVETRAPATEAEAAPEDAPAETGMVERVDDTGSFEADDTRAEEIEGVDYNDPADITEKRLLQTVYFGYDRFDLSETTRRTLKENATKLQAYPSWRVRVDGHCDERGTIEYNLELGAKRARAVVEYLGQLGVDVTMLEVRSFGEERPQAMGNDEAAWSQNRRAEFTVISVN